MGVRLCRPKFWTTRYQPSWIWSKYPPAAPLLGASGVVLLGCPHGVHDRKGSCSLWCSGSLTSRPIFIETRRPLKKSPHSTASLQAIVSPANVDLHALRHPLLCQWRRLNLPFSFCRALLSTATTKAPSCEATWWSPYHSSRGTVLSSKSALPQAASWYAMMDRSGSAIFHKVSPQSWWRSAMATILLVNSFCFSAPGP